MMENDDNSRGRGRPKNTGEVKSWIDYVEALKRAHPASYLTLPALYAHMTRENGTAVHGSIDSFRKVLNGDMLAKAGFSVALSEAMKLQAIGLGAADLDLPIEEFVKRLSGARPPSLAQAIANGRDGTELKLERGIGNFRHFGGPSDVKILDADVAYQLSIERPLNADGISGHILLLGYGQSDHRWQIVSAGAERPVSPTANIQWGLLTDIILKPRMQMGTFLLFAIGSRHPFGTAAVAIFEQIKGNGRFLSDAEVAALQTVVTSAVDGGAWTAELAYAIR